jgi:hypothetical protein
MAPQVTINQLFSGLIALAFRLQVNAQLLAFLVQMAALQAQSARYIGHVVMMAAQFGEQHFPLEGFDAVRQRAVFNRGRWLAVSRRRQCQIHFVSCDGFGV